jgi:hypothetical protein
MSKGAERVVHENVLLRQQFAQLKSANKAATRQELHKRKQIQKVPLQLRRFFD